MANIRISKKDKEEYNKLTRNAKAKMKRLQKQGIDLVGEIELPPLSAFENRKQFNEWKDFTNKFNKGLKKEYKVFTTESGMKLLGKEIETYQKKEKEAIRLATEFYQSRTPQHEQEFKKSTNLDIPNHIPWNKLEDRGQFKARMDMLNRRDDPMHFIKRDADFLNNFIKSVEGSFDHFWLSEEVIKRLQKIDPKDLSELMAHHDFSEIFNFEIYDSDGQQVGAHLGHLEKMNEILIVYEEHGLSGVMEENDSLLKNFPNKF